MTELCLHRQRAVEWKAPPCCYWILYSIPVSRASKFASFKFVMHTAPRAVEYRSRLFMNRQTSAGGTRRTKYYRLASRPPGAGRRRTAGAAMHAIAEKGLFMYSTSQLCSSSASRIMDLINKLIWAIRGGASAHSPLASASIFLKLKSSSSSSKLPKSGTHSEQYSPDIYVSPGNLLEYRESSAPWNASRLRFCNGKERSEIPPLPSPPSRIMISSPALLWESS